MVKFYLCKGITLGGTQRFPLFLPPETHYIHITGKMLKNVEQKLGLVPTVWYRSSSCPFVNKLNEIQKVWPKTIRPADKIAESFYLLSELNSFPFPSHRLILTISRMTAHHLMYSHKQRKAPSTQTTSHAIALPTPGARWHTTKSAPLPPHPSINSHTEPLWRGQEEWWKCIRPAH